MNEVLKRKDDLGVANYILNPNPDHNYWANISAGRLKEFVARRGDAFNVVLVGSPNG